MDDVVSEEVVSIIATHQGRIRCIVQAASRKPNEIHRFMNSAVIKMTIDGTSRKGTMELVHDGDYKSNHKGKRYYTEKTAPEAREMTIQFPLDASTDTRALYDNLITSNDIGPRKYIFFILRHGEASHNKMKGLTKFMQSVRGKRDTELTDTGEIQAANVAVELSKNLTLFKEFRSAKYLFSSDLQRAMKTLAIVVGTANSLDQQGNDEQAAKTINILPCAHELNYVASGKPCDGSFRQSAQGEENKPCSAYDPPRPKVFHWDREVHGSESHCKHTIEWKSAVQFEGTSAFSANNSTPRFAVNPDLPNGADKVGPWVTTRKYEGEFQLNWQPYREFYGNGLRAEAKAERRKCRETNFLLQAVTIIRSMEPQGGELLRTSDNPKYGRPLPMDWKKYNETPAKFDRQKFTAHGSIGGGNRGTRRRSKKRTKRTRSRSAKKGRSRRRSRRTPRIEHNTKR